MKDFGHLGTEQLEIRYCSIKSLLFNILNSYYFLSLYSFLTHSKNVFESDQFFEWFDWQSEALKERLFNELLLLSMILDEHTMLFYKFRIYNKSNHDICIQICQTDTEVIKILIYIKYRTKNDEKKCYAQKLIKKYIDLSENNAKGEINFENEEK